MDGFSGTYNFIRVRPAGGQTGSFALRPAESSVIPGRTTTMSLDWTVPFGGWRVLKTVELRLRDAGSARPLWVRFNEAANTLSLYDPNTRRFGPARALGSNGVLANRFVQVHLKTSAVTAAGPTAPKMTLKLDVTFKNSTAGRRYKVQAAASDDLGHADGFADAGTLAVTGRRAQGA
jgi:hypothetical protein